MQKLIPLGLIAAALLGAVAVDRITVEGLEHTLAAGALAHRSDSDLLRRLGGDTELLRSPGQDADLAGQIDALSLSERLTAATLAKMVARYQPGLKTERALELLADRSALLDPPANELPDQPAPGMDAQQRMVTAARAYVFGTLLRLPNFFATRTTAHLEDDAGAMREVGLTAPPGLHLMGTSSLEITFRDGQEYIAPAQGTPMTKSVPPMGLESSGEFGVLPARIFLDTANSALAFHHWEQTPAGLAAVFRYVVSKADSHYQVNYTCTINKSFHDVPGYHGSISIDPSSGAVLGITLEADWRRGDPISHVAAVIEYGAVAIGDRRYICPLRSLAFLTEEANVCNRGSRTRKLAQPVAMLNRITFTRYHRLGSTMRIITGAEAGSAAHPSAPAASASDPGTQNNPAAAPLPAQPGTSSSPAKPNRR